MCGIAGSTNEAAVDLILKAQHRRGPDHQRLLRYPDAGLVFGHNRLSILDLDPRSNQPFEDERLRLVYNGEVYNFVELKAELILKGHYFKTSSDTEVVLKAYEEWGLKAFERFNGMFALAIHDRVKKQTVLVRDRFGVKPLFYSIQNGQLTFASNAKAIARTISAKVNWNYLNLGLAFDLYEGLSLETAFEGVNALAPGRILIFENGKARTERFYDLTTRVENLRSELAELDEAELVRKLRELLLSAVEIRLRADVPVTLSLSGGLDSGLCAALMREVRGRSFDVFTFGQTQLKGSESALAAKSAKHLDLKMNYAEIRAEDTSQIFDATLDAQNGPFAHPTVMAQNTVFRAIQKGGYKVAIGGQGADEGFAGYRKFQLFYLKELMSEGALGSLATEGVGVSRTLFKELISPQRYFYYLTRFKRGQKLSLSFIKGELPNAPLRSSRSLADRQILDVEALSLPTLLRYEDSNSMYYSIESRMPFLDYRVMEFGLALPAARKVHRGYGKWLLRKVAEPYLPKEIVWDRNKRAFSLDQGWWLKNGLAAEFQKQLADPDLKTLISEDFKAELAKDVFYTNPNDFTKLSSLAWLKRNGEFWR